MKDFAFYRTDSSGNIRQSKNSPKHAIPSSHFLLTFVSKYLHLASEDVLLPHWIAGIYPSPILNIDFTHMIRPTVGAEPNYLIWHFYCV